ncbi:hypothetical protein HOE04_00645 [archaeon]|jgi:hypothetical protein|nr:hypothetical protein [archaeon]
MVRGLNEKNLETVVRKRSKISAKIQEKDRDLERSLDLLKSGSKIIGCSFLTKISEISADAMNYENFANDLHLFGAGCLFIGGLFTLGGFIMGGRDYLKLQKLKSEKAEVYEKEEFIKDCLTNSRENNFNEGYGLRRGENILR